MQSNKTDTASCCVIKVRGLHKNFGPREVLRGIDLDVRAGDILSVMGPSGSGKSTLLYCMAGILAADKGEVFFNGKNLAHYSANSLIALRKTSFGFIFQFGELISELTVRDNIALPLLLRGVRKKQAYKTADEWASLVGVQNVISALPHTLSGGEMQRTAIARAMAINPEVIFADEPTGSLDSVNAKKVMELFVWLANKYRKTVIIITHSEEVAVYADRHILLKDGLIESSVTRTSP